MWRTRTAVRHGQRLRPEERVVQVVMEMMRTIPSEPSNATLVVLAALALLHVGGWLVVAAS